MANYFTGMESQSNVVDTRGIRESVKPFFGPTDPHANDICMETEELTKAELLHNFGVNKNQLLQWELTTMTKMLFELIVKCLTEKRDKCEEDLTYTFLDCFTVKAESRMVEDIENGGVFNYTTITGPAYQIDSIDDCIGTLIKRKSDFPPTCREGGPINVQDYLNAVLENTDDPEEYAAQAMVLDNKLRTLLANEYKQLISVPLVCVTWCKLYLDNLIGRLIVEAYESLSKSVETGEDTKNVFSVQFFEVAKPTLKVTQIVDENNEPKLKFEVFIHSAATTRMNNKQDGAHDYEAQI